MGAWTSTSLCLDEGRAIKYRLMRDGVPLSYLQLLELWQSDADFRSFFIDVLADAPFSGYRWETPPLTKSTAVEAFEFVLFNSPGFENRTADSQTFREFFTDDADEQGVVSFANLRGDSTLIVPSPRAASNAYGHLAAFVRRAPRRQADALWRVTGAEVTARLGASPIWLNTAGGGVAWLHVRLDSTPKYYRHAPYREVPAA